MDKLRKEYSIIWMCKIFSVTRSAYYSWIDKGNPIMNNYKNDIAEIISVEHYNTNEVYGTIRLKHHIQNKYGLIINHKLIRRYKKTQQLTTVTRLKRKLTFNVSKVRPKYMAKNIIKNNFTSAHKFDKLSTDVSYIKCTDGLLYLSAVKDLFDNKIISYKLSTKNNTDLVLDTLKDVPKHNGIIHSDQGTLYYSYQYRNKLRELGYTRSMSRRGACWENSPIENWFSQLKEEHLRRVGKKTMKQTKEEIKKYVHWYNHERIQKALGYLSPEQYSNNI